MRYAVFVFGGNQYKVQEGEEILIPGEEGKVGEKITFDKILLFSDEGKVSLGKPHVAGVNIQGKILAHEKGEKIRVVKFRAKSRYRRVRGHRSIYTKVKIEKISKT